jgi:sulfur-carrier protein
MRIVFFAQLREQLGAAGIEVAATEANSLEKLKQHLIDLHPEWKTFLTNPSLLTAINHQYIKTQKNNLADIKLNDADEIAFFPPVTGG